MPPIKDMRATVLRLHEYTLCVGYYCTDMPLDSRIYRPIADFTVPKWYEWAAFVI